MVKPLSAVLLFTSLGAFDGIRVLKKSEEEKCTKEMINAALAPARREMRQCVEAAGDDTSTRAACRCTFVGAREVVFTDLSTTCPVRAKAALEHLEQVKAEYCSASGDDTVPAELVESALDVSSECTKEDIATALAPARTEMKQCVAEAGFDISAIAACMCAFVGAQEAVYADLSSTCPSLAPYFERASASLAEARAQYCSESKEAIEPAELLEMDAMSSTFLNLVNTARSRQGLRNLTYNSNLNRAAARHAADYNQDSHTGSDGSSIRDRVAASGYSPMRAWGENVYWEYGSGTGAVKNAFDWWMQSPGHRANILSSSFKEMGFKRHDHSPKKWTWYFCQVFGSRG